MMDGLNDFEIENGVLLRYHGAQAQVRVPENVTAVGDLAFNGCMSLRRVSFPAGLKSIGKRAFSGCEDLEAIALPPELTEIGDAAFFGCVSLSAVSYADKKQRNQLFRKGFRLSPAFVRLADEPADLPPERVLPAVLGYVLGFSARRVDKGGYRTYALDSYRKNPAADAAAAALDHAKLMALLEKWIADDGPCWYAPYAAFANDAELSALLARLKAWEKDDLWWGELIRVRGAVLLNDTVTAMRYADKTGLLERYAAMRGADADALRDDIISDFGLDENGRRGWPLGGRTVTAVLNDDLTFTLTDERGGVLKSVPKRGASAAEHALVKNEFSALKKDVRATAKTRRDIIFTEFLSGKERPGGAWKSAYLGNPVLRILARLIVWEQNKTTFVLTSGGARLANGAPYTVTELPVKAAHPMEMAPADVEAWQRYFTENALKQPFEQIWEPVTEASLVKPGRYNGFTVPLYTLMHREKDGIFLERRRFSLAGCSAKLIFGSKGDIRKGAVPPGTEWIYDEYEVQDFGFSAYTRQVNHIVGLLDKAVIADKVRKDDVTAAQWFDRFTLAQIRSFIDLANRYGAVGVQAALMEYKNTRFADYNCLDEFTLDW